MHILFCCQLKFFFCCFFFKLVFLLSLSPESLIFPWLYTWCGCFAPVLCMYNATSITCKVTLPVILRRRCKVTDGLQFWQCTACVPEARIWPSRIMEILTNISKMSLFPCITRSCTKHSLSNTCLECDLNWGEAFLKILNEHIWSSERTVSHLWPAYCRLSNFHPITPGLYLQYCCNISITVLHLKLECLSVHGEERESIYFLCLLLWSLGNLEQPEEWLWTVSCRHGVWTFLT